MIPLRSTERVSSRTPVTVALIAINVLIFLYQATLNPYDLQDLVMRFGIIPDLFTGALRIATLGTSMFLHGGWVHLLGNMLFLWVFGRNLEDNLGGSRFLGFYLLVGMIAGVVHVVANPYSRVPTIGASGAIAGVMGAYLIKFPKSSIITLIPVFVFVTTMEIPTVLLLLYWFALQFFSSLGALSSQSYTGGGIAWFAHVGGFIAGMLLIKLFPSAKPRWRAWYDEE